LVAATVGLALALVACGDPNPTDDAWAIEGPVRDLPLDLERPEGRPGPNGGTLLDASSAPIEHSVAYRFALGHCGLASPIDLDGSFWDAIDGVTAGGTPLDLASDPEMINATGGVIAIIGDEARFQTESGSVVRFSRHPGEKEFPGCD
jgi:hypothetical protein